MTYYDFVSDDRLQEALDVMQEQGKYKYFTVDDLRNCFRVYGYLESSASSNVSSARSEGNDFSYVTNEYRISYNQPHDYKNPNIFRKFIVPDDSAEFLNVLVDVNRKYIAQTKGGLEGFNIITSLDDTSGYDYEEKIEMYKAKKSAIISFLNNLDRKAPKFRSKKSGLTIKDVKNKYDLLLTNKLDVISSYIDSTGSAKNLQTTSNKIIVNIENNRLKYNKAVDQAAITEYATTNYDHTFTENLINVVRDESQGLYQARPKTAFDEVVVKMHKAREEVSRYNEILFQLNDDLSRYSGALYYGADPQAVEKCNKLLNELDNEYLAFTDEAKEVVEECLDENNQNFVSGKSTKKSLISKSVLVKAVIAFIIGGMLVFIFCVWISILMDKKKLKYSQRQLQEIKKIGKGE